MNWLLIVSISLCCITKVLSNWDEATLDESEIFRYDGVPCDECNEKYDGPCPLHVLKKVEEYKTNYEYFMRRAAKTIPRKILGLEESSIPGAGGGIWTIKKIPKDVIFGPLDAKIVELEDNKTIDDMFLKIPGKNFSYFNLMDLSKANYLALINCARNLKEQNLIRYFNKTDEKFYFKTKQVIPKYEELLIDYGTDFRKTIGISDLDYERPRDLKNKGLSCKICKRTYYNIGFLKFRHELDCRNLYKKISKHKKSKPYIVYRRGKYKIFDFRLPKNENNKHQTITEPYYDKGIEYDQFW